MRWQYLTSLPSSRPIFNFWMVPVAIFKIGVPATKKHQMDKLRNGKTARLHTFHILIPFARPSCPLGPFHTLQLAKATRPGAQLMAAWTSAWRVWSDGMHGMDHILQHSIGKSRAIHATWIRSFDGAFKEFVWICETWFDWPAYEFFFLSIVYMLWNCGLCSKNQLLSDKIGVWWEASRCFSIHSDATCIALLSKNAAFGRQNESLKGRRFFAFEFRTLDHLMDSRYGGLKPKLRVRKMWGFYALLTIWTSFVLCHAMAMLCCKEWQIGSHVIFVVYYMWYVWFGFVSWNGL